MGIKLLIVIFLVIGQLWMNKWEVKFLLGYKVVTHNIDGKVWEVPNLNKVFLQSLYF